MAEDDPDEAERIGPLNPVNVAHVEPRLVEKAAYGIEFNAILKRRYARVSACERSVSAIVSSRSGAGPLCSRSCACSRRRCSRWLSALAVRPRRAVASSAHRRRRRPRVVEAREAREAREAPPRARARRAGSAPGELVMGGQRVQIRRPRARTLDGKELPLPSWTTFGAKDPLAASPAGGTVDGSRSPS